MSDRLRYADIAAAYFEAGWLGTLPLPYRRKFPPPAGWTGKGAPYPDRDQIEAWRGEHGRGGVGQRLLSTIVGLDVDGYGDKAGGDSFAQLLEECGPLPATWMSTSRDDGVSGIRFYTVPTGVRWAERRAGGGIDLIHCGHRYAVVWPSIHPEGRQYRWYTPTGQLADRIPQVAELPRLPATWGRRLTEQVVSLQRNPRVARISDPDAARSAAENVLDKTIDFLATLRPGMKRNNALNRKAYLLAGYVVAGLLDETTVYEALFDAATINGSVAKKGPAQVDRTIRSGMTAGQRHPITGVAS
jgi:hypothetical protein